MQSLVYENNKIHRSLFFPLFFSAIIWGVKIIESALPYSFAKFGIYPKTLFGLKGVLFAPFIHDDFSHLVSNTVPLVILGAMLFFFYPRSGLKAMALIWLIGGLAVWATARSAYHIGASGLVFGLVSFLLFSGIIHKKRQLYAVSLIIIFLYGSMIQGVFPGDIAISWEGHLSGFISGGFAAVIFMKIEPYNSVYDKELVKEDFENITISEPEFGDKFSEVEYFFKAEE